MSAVAGETDTNKIAFFEGFNHYGINVDFQKCAEDKTYNVLDKAVDNNLNWNYKLWANILRKLNS